MADDSNVPMDKMVELAMGLSMSALFTRAMSATYESTQKAFDTACSPQPLRYIHAVIGGVQQGPFSLGEIFARIRSGEITPDTYIWKAGMQDWRPAREVDDLAPNFPSMPPRMP